MGQIVGRVRVDPKFNFTPPGGNTTAAYRSVLTCVTKPVTNDTIQFTYTSSDTTFTFKSVLTIPAVDTEVLIGATATTAMTNLAAAMTAVTSDADWVAVFLAGAKTTGDTVTFVLAETASITYTGTGSITQGEVIASSSNVDHRRYVEATVEDSDGYSNGMLWVKIVEDVASSSTATSRKILTKSGTVSTTGVTESIPLNTGGGVLRFIAANGDAPTGVLFICTDGATSGGLPILPRESYEIDSRVRSISISSSGTNLPYTLCYLVNA